MRKYTLEYEKRCLATDNAPINIVKYMVYKNEEDINHFILLEMFNDMNVVIRQTEFEITQYNEAEEAILKANYVFKNFNAAPSKITMLQEKIMIDESCLTIKAKLVHAVSATNNSWIDGTWTDNDLIPASSLVEENADTTLVDGNKFEFRYYITIAVVILFVASLILFFKIVYP